LYDTNKNGAIELEQFAAILKSLEVEANDEKITAIITKVDKNQDGQVDFEEFVHALTSLITRNSEITSEPENIDTLRKWSTHPDADSKHRKMSRHEPDELVQILTSLTRTVTEKSRLKS
jgi:hypothetical protein